LGKFALGLLLVLVNSAAWAQMYKCIDERGRTHYTDKPIPGCKPAAGSRLAPPRAAGPAAPSSASAKGATKAKRAPKVLMTEEEQLQLASRCKTLQEQYDWLLSPRGAAVEAHAARVGQLKQAMRGCP
jgi:hypothetical protein